MSTFNERILQYRLHMGLLQKDFSDILKDEDGQPMPPTTVNSYFTQGRTPTYRAFLAMGDRLCIDLNWFSGAADQPMWAPAVTQARLAVRLAAETPELCDPDFRAHSRIIRVVHLIQEYLPRATEDWFIAGLLHLAPSGEKRDAAGAEKQILAYARFMLGRGASSATLTRAASRLSLFTGLTEKWLAVGGRENLPLLTADEFGPWATVWREAVRRGQTPDQYLKHADSIARLFKEHDELLA